jgi:hypothetical protein
MAGGAEGLEDGAVQQVGPDGFARIEAEDQYEQRRHQRAATHTGHTDQSSYAEAQQNELPGTAAHFR